MVNSYEIHRCVHIWAEHRCVHIWAVVFQLPNPETPLKVTTLLLKETMVCHVGKHVGQSPEVTEEIGFMILLT